MTSVADYFPPDGHVQELYCDTCGGYLDLRFELFHELVSSVDIRIEGLPVLRCDGCNLTFLPDNSRYAIIRLHEQATEKESQSVRVKRTPDDRRFAFSEVPFRYSADEYFYTPGLVRPWDEGFLTPIYFNKRVLSRYDREPDYFLRFCSRTYGDIRDAGDFIASFGINRHGSVIMWLGDVAKLPIAEQYYLMSECIEPEFSLGSEFYDGQISCRFSEPSLEDELAYSRGLTISAFVEKYGMSISHLDEEVLDLLVGFHGPMADSILEWERISNTLCRVHVESLSNSNLNRIEALLGIEAVNGGAMRQLSHILENLSSKETADRLLLPLFCIYDLRIAHQHLTSAARKQELTSSAFDRLGLPLDPTVKLAYDRIAELLKTSYEEIASLVNGT